MKKVLLVADAPGPAESIAPLPALLASFEVSLLGTGKANNVFSSLSHSEVSTPEEAIEFYKQHKPDCLVAAISSLILNGPFVNNALIECASADKIPIICIQDIWGNHRWPSNKKYLSSYAAACVLDEYAASLWKEDGFQGEIIVTGNAGFDRFASIDVLSQKEKLRAHFQVPDGAKIILYPGQGTPRALAGDKKSFQFLADALKRCGRKDIILVYRPHPRAVETGYYQKASEGLTTLDTQEFQFTEEILPLADVVVSMYSTNLIHSCILRIPAVSLMLPGAGQETLESLNIADFPPNLAGATTPLYDEDPLLLIKTIEYSLENEEYRAVMRKNQELEFPFRGSAAEKVAQVIKRFA